MSDFTYKLSLGLLSGSAALSEASREELRVLLALVAAGGAVESEDSLASLSLVSKARCISALSFWEESGVISRDDGNPTVSEEFAERLAPDEIYEEESLVVASQIRNENLASMLEECATLMELPALSNTEIKQISALCTQLALSPEYVLTLAAALAKQGKLRVGKLVSEATRLSGRGVDKLESLEAYISLTESAENNNQYWEYRRVMGIYNRNLSKSEQERFGKWEREFGYSAAIVSEAYDVAVESSSGKSVSAYMDKVLTAWHKAGCKTVSECRAKREADRAIYASKAEPKKYKKSTPEKPRYGDFDIGDAFNKALMRSYGEEDK